ncbi:MAG: amino acid adenylation domain-containing protein [Sandaracinaceae bacterium]
MQRGMVIESVMSQRAGLNVEQVVAQLDEIVDVPRLEAAWARLVDRHDILRSRFLWEGLDEPLLEVHPAAALTVRRIDLPRAELETFLAQDRARGVALNRLPPMRVTLLRHARDAWTMVWTFHHALLDGRAFTLALEELFDLYDRAPRDVRPVRPFRDHAEAAGALDRTAAEAYFRDRLRGYEDPLALPIERGPISDAPHREVERRVPRAVLERLDAFARRAGTTMYTALLAAWAIVLSRYARRSDVVFGSTRAGRHTIDGADRMLGCFINTVPVRVQIDEAAPVADLLRAVRRDSIAVRPFEQTPLDLIARWSELPPSAALLTTNVVFERYLMDARLRARGEKWGHRRFEVREEGSFPLTLAGYLDDGLLLRIEYDPERYATRAVERLVGHVGHVLAQLGEAVDDTTIGALRMMDDVERAQRIAAGVPTDPVPPITDTYPDRFEAVARAHPERPAIRVAGGEPISYGELELRANQLAWHLEELGARPDERIGVCLPRDADFAVAVLAVLKSGAAYVPVDPSYPTDAIAHMLEDSGARFVLASAETKARIVNPRVRVVDLARNAVAVDARPTEPPRRTIRPDNLAYVIYTSGSTGLPKGVMIEHRALLGHNVAIGELYGLVSTDRQLAFAALSFDVAVEEMFPTWLAGAEVVMRTTEMAQSVPTFLERVAADEITVLNLPTAFFHEVVPYLEGGRATLSPSVRLVLVGGEKASRGMLRRWQAIGHPARWLNCYGPTEATVTCTAFEPAREDVAGRVPIGRPTANARAYVLDERREPVPTLVPGELWIAGQAVARGYLNHPELTDERFVVDPFVDGRMYRTGDLVSWDEDDQLDYLGRVDRQVKVRGFRIEPGEVEAALVSLEGVREAVVDARNGALVAWVVGTSLDPAALRRKLEDRLPPHMRPRAIGVLDALPLTPGGKIALGELPDPGPAARQARREQASELAERLAGLFAEALDRDALDVDESFFDAGGHSLLALRLASRIEHALGVRVTSAALMGAPTPRELAKTLESRAPQWACLVPIKRTQLTAACRPLFGIHVLGDNGSYFRPLADALGDDIAVYGLRTPLRGARPTEVADIAALYVEEMLRFQPEGPYHVAAVSLGGAVAYEVVRQLREREKRVGLVAMLDAFGPGGMVSIPGWRRLARHAARMRREGPGYLLSKLDARRQRFVRLARRATVRGYALLGRDVTAELQLESFLEANEVAALSYAFPRYAGEIVVYRATDDIFYDDAFRRSGLGWDACVEGHIEVVDVPGDHLTILFPPNVDVLAARVREGLLRAEHS